MRVSSSSSPSDRRGALSGGEVTACWDTCGEASLPTECGSTTVAVYKNILLSLLSVTLLRGPTQYSRKAMTSAIMGVVTAER